MDNCTIPLKRCSKCKRELPATTEYFNKNKSTKDGLQTCCKACQCEQARHYRTKSVEKIREYSRQWRAANREKIREDRRQWSADNLDKKRENERRRRSRKANAPFTFTAEHERLALEYFHNCCAVCGRQLKDLFSTHTAAMDHWIPLSKGGGSTPDNMIPLCHGVGGCNESKGVKDAVEWLERKFGKRKAAEIRARVEAYFEYAKSTD